MLLLLMLDDKLVLLLQSSGMELMSLLLMLFSLRMRYSDDCGVGRGPQRYERRLRL